MYALRAEMSKSEGVIRPWPKNCQRFRKLTVEYAVGLVADDLPGGVSALESQD